MEQEPHGSLYLYQKLLALHNLVSKPYYNQHHNSHYILHLVPHDTLLTSVLSDHFVAMNYSSSIHTSLDTTLLHFLPYRSYLKLTNVITR